MPPTFKPKVAYIDKKERQRRLEIVAKLAKGSCALVGVKDASSTYPGETATVGQVAAWMEFGTETVPARSFLRTPIDTMGADFEGVRERAMDKLLSGQISIATALEQMGFFVSNRIRNTIIQGIDPGLALTTRKLKRTDRPNKGVSSTPDTPLMDTGKLLGSIGYEVYLGDAGGGE